MSKELTEQEFRSIVREELRRLFEDDIGFENLPPGWDRESLTSFARSLTDRTQDDPEGFFTKCYERMQDEEGFDEDSAKRFCASLKDEYLQTTQWRGED